MAMFGGVGVLGLGWNRSIVFVEGRVVRCVAWMVRFVCGSHSCSCHDARRDVERGPIAKRKALCELGACMMVDCVVSTS